MAQPTVEPITETALPEFSQFLQKNMPVVRSAAEWESGLRRQWIAELPNFGFLLRSDAGAVVGGIGAYYADRTINGKAQRFCNITSWCVLDAYRQQSMKLAMAVIKQPAFTFTDFSPTKVVAGTLKFFKFKELDEREAVVLNLPGLSVTLASVLHKSLDIEAALSGDALKIYRDHVVFPWLKHLIVGQSGNWCHVIYKRSAFKGLPAATVLYLGDQTLFNRHFRRVATFLLLRGMVSTHIECRMLDQQPWPSTIRSGFIRKVFLSESLEDRHIDYLYSERMALNL